MFCLFSDLVPEQESKMAPPYQQQHEQSIQPLYANVSCPSTSDTLWNDANSVHDVITVTGYARILP